jgi:hypothetical protein
MAIREAPNNHPEIRIQVDPGLIPGNSERFKRQVEFLLEIDQLKHTLRQTILLDRSRHENSVEHSWHIALSVMIFAEYMDRFQAFLHNYFTQGKVWRQHGIRRQQVLRRMQAVERGAPLLWDYVRTLIDDAVHKGFLLP